MNATNDLDSLIPGDLISVREAARLVNNCHVGAIRRWILSGKLRGYKLAGYRYLVSRADVLNLIQPHVKHEPELPPTRREMTARQKHVEAHLRELGVIK